jgi:putative spermidine/putrescine transport system ATP-binding protein
VLGFVGLSSRIRGRVVASDQGQVTIDTGYGRVSARSRLETGAAVSVAMRPERLHIGANPAANAITVRFRDLAFQGSKALLHFAGVDGDQIMVETADLALDTLQPGAETPLSWSVDDTLVYPAGDARP